MFEVGKKYKYGSHIYTCMYVGKKYSVLESKEDGECLPYNYMANGHYGWSEYKEPVIHTRYGLWCKHNSRKEVHFLQSPNWCKSEKDIADWFSSACSNFALLRIVKLTFTENE